MHTCRQKHNSRPARLLIPPTPAASSSKHAHRPLPKLPVRSTTPSSPPSCPTKSAPSPSRPPEHQPQAASATLARTPMRRAAPTPVMPLSLLIPPFFLFSNECTSVDAQTLPLCPRSPLVGPRRSPLRPASYPRSHLHLHLHPHCHRPRRRNDVASRPRPHLKPWGVRTSAPQCQARPRCQLWRPRTAADAASHTAPRAHPTGPLQRRQVAARPAQAPVPIASALLRHQRSPIRLRQSLLTLLQYHHMAQVLDQVRVDRRLVRLRRHHPLRFYTIGQRRTSSRS